MTKKAFLITICTVLSLYCFAQKSPEKAAAQPNPYSDSLKKYELILKSFSDTILDSRQQINRIIATINFIPTFVQALKFPGSFDYPFDSLRFMHKLEPADKSFRMYNWVLKYNDGTCRYYSAIQWNTYGDSLKLTALRDYSAKMDTDIERVVLDKDRWYGALYYDIFTMRAHKKTYYFLLGWRAQTPISNEKEVEVMTIEDGKPIFGAPVFVDKDKKVKDRYTFQFRKDATMLLNFIPEQKLITFDNLVPPNPQAEGKYFTYAPDGTYGYFAWKHGKWVYQEKELFEGVKRPIKEAGQ